MASVDGPGDDPLRPGDRVIDSLDARRAFAAVSEGLLGTPGDPVTVGRFVVEQRVGAGGMGVVYAAFDPELDRRVAIKVLQPGAAGRGQERLLSEARALARLNHPNIVSVHEIGTVDDRVFIAMELVQGVPMSAWLRDARSWTDVARVALQAGRGLIAAHEAGIVHRDFKPANVMIRDDGRVVVLDFGLARLRGGGGGDSLGSTDLGDRDFNGTDPHTQTSAIIGTPAYMAPEQHLGRSATALSDQFSFCVALYEALYGQRPFEASTRFGLLDAIDRGRFRPRPTSRRVPARLARALVRGLRSAPADRWPSMEALLAAIEATRDAPRRRKQLGLLTVGVAIAAYAAFAPTAGKTEPCTQAARQLEGLWDPSVRASLDVRYAQSAAWPHLRGRIDASTATWTHRWQATCEATHVHGSQSAARLDQRMACLEADRVALAAAVGQLTGGDRDLIQRAAGLSVFDQDGARCDAEDLSRRIPVPVAGPQREHYDMLLGVAAEQYAVAALANDPTGALATLDALPVGPQSHPDVVRLVENARAEAYRQLDRPTDAYAAWTRAARAADAAGDDVSFVGVASVLAFMDVQDFDRPDAAEVWLERARSRAQTVELPHKERFGLALRAAVVTRFGGKPETAAKDLETLLRTEGPELTSGDEGTLRHNLAELYGVLQHWDDAVAQYRLAIDLRSTALGPDHRQVGQSRFLLSQLLIERGKLDDAEHELQAAAEIFAHVQGGAPERIMVEGTRAIMAAERDDLPLADQRMTATIALAQAEWGPQDRRLATFLVNHGRLLMMRDNLQEAASQVQRGLELETQALGPQFEGLADGLSLWAEIEFLQGRPADAERLAQRAAAVATAPQVKLQHEFDALRWHAYVQCDADRATAQLRAFVDAAAPRSNPDALQAMRDAVQALPDALAAYPGCTP